MGEVYRARDTRLGRDVAIKILPAAFTRDGDRLARLEREARAPASLNHPHIAAIYGVEDSDGVRALCSSSSKATRWPNASARAEPSASTRRWPSRGRSPTRSDAAHEKGIVHGDVQPANIKVRSDSVVKVLDFGQSPAGGVMAAQVSAAHIERPAELFSVPTRQRARAT
jgi:serine/threonine protein kinase